MPVRMMMTAMLAILMIACGGQQPPAPAPQLAGEEAEGTEPELKTPGEVAPERHDPVKQVEAEYVSFEGGLRAYPAERRVEMEAILLSEQTRPLEFLLVAPGGATHESLFATGAQGGHLKRALEIIGLKEAETKRFGRGYFEKPLGDRVKISVRFKHEESRELMETRVENWLWDHRRNSTPEPVGFVFTGSHEQVRAELNRSAIEADMKGSLIALWRDASCVLDNDRDNGTNPDVYSPNPNAPGIPSTRMGQPVAVTLIFEPHE